MGVGGADNPAGSRRARMGRALALRAGLRHRLGAARRQPQARRALPRRPLRRGPREGRAEAAFDAAEGAFSVWHYEHRFPICPLSYPIILDRALARSARSAPTARPSFSPRASACASCRGDGPGAPDRLSRGGRGAESAARRRRRRARRRLRGAIERAVNLINGTPGDSGKLRDAAPHPRGAVLPAGPLAHGGERHQLSPLLRHQRPRRACASRSPRSSTAAHETVFRLVARRPGRRAAHRSYRWACRSRRAMSQALQRRGRAAASTSSSRRSSSRAKRCGRWPVAGTTGYDVLNLIDGAVRRHRRREAAFDALYRRIMASERSYGVLLRGAKTEILETSFASELEVLVVGPEAHRRYRPPHPRFRRRTRSGARSSRSSPAFRSTAPTSTSADADPEDRAPDRRRGRGGEAPERAAGPHRARLRQRSRCSARSTPAVPAGPTRSSSAASARRFQQLTGPVMAKSLEDTLFYRYVRASRAERGRRRPRPFRHRRRAPSTPRSRRGRATGRTP